MSLTPGTQPLLPVIEKQRKQADRKKNCRMQPATITKNRRRFPTMTFWLHPPTSTATREPFPHSSTNMNSTYRWRSANRCIHRSTSSDTSLINTEYDRPAAKRTSLYKCRAQRQKPSSSFVNVFRLLPRVINWLSSLNLYNKYWTRDPAKEEATTFRMHAFYVERNLSRLSNFYKLN